MKEIYFSAPDDWHCHLRDGDYLKRTVPDTAQQFRRAIIMPNLVVPITTVVEAENYLKRIKVEIPKESAFMPLMTLYLTEEMLPSEINKAKTSTLITACKLYPKGATTHSQAGISQIKTLFPLLEIMQAVDLPLLIHAEVVDDAVDIFDREAHFIQEQLIPILKNFPKLRVVMEHISTKLAVEFIEAASPLVAATITPHHLWLNRNDLLVGGVKPHFYCLPIVKSKEDQHALINAAISGNPKFFLGTDSAPHPQTEKESRCGCAGIYNAYAALSLYAEIFDGCGALDKFPNFASAYGAHFYQLPQNHDKVMLINKPWRVPDFLPYGNSALIPFGAGKQLKWQLQKL